MNDLTTKRSVGAILATGLRTNARQYAMFIALLGIWAIFSILIPLKASFEGHELAPFLAPRNITNLMLQTSYIAVLAIGMVLVIVAGHIDLSVGFLAGFCGAVAAYLQAKLGVPDIIAIIAAIGVGVLAGLWQGFWIAYRRIPAFIVTLAGMLIFKGCIMLVTGGETITPRGTDFKAIGQGFIPQVFMKGTVGVQVPFHDLTLLVALVCIGLFVAVTLSQRRNRLRFGFEVLPPVLEVAKLIFVGALIAVFFWFLWSYRGLPWSILLLGVLVVIYEFLTRKTVFGRHVYALGGNKDAARLSGVNIQARTLQIFVSMGALSAVSGVIFTARLNSATAQAGTLFELDAIAAAIIGGTSTLGGEGTISGAIIGALVMASLNNGMELLGVPTHYQWIVKGLILLLAVWFDISTRSGKKT